MSPKTLGSGSAACVVFTDMKKHIHKDTLTEQKQNQLLEEVNSSSKSECVDSVV